MMTPPPPTYEEEEDEEDEDKDDDYDINDQEDDDDAVDVVPEKIEEESKYDEATKALIAVAEAARKAFTEAERDFGDTVREIKEVKDSLEKDYGEEGEFSVLVGQCFELTDNEYKYTMCAFDHCRYFATLTPDLCIPHRCTLNTANSTLNTQHYCTSCPARNPSTEAARPGWAAGAPGREGRGRTSIGS